jgi:hypothetical protein
MTDTEIAERTRMLESTKLKLQKMYRKKQPKPENMTGRRLANEYHLLATLVGTIYLTSKMFKRWRRVNQEYASRMAC